MGKKTKPAEPKSTVGSKQAWKLMDRGSSVAATAASREVPAFAWRILTGRKPPVSPKNPDAPMREIVLWSFIGGGLAELVRVLIKRSAAIYWVKSTGHLPPGMKPLVKPVADVPAAGQSPTPE